MSVVVSDDTEQQRADRRPSRDGGDSGSDPAQRRRVVVGALALAGVALVIYAGYIVAVVVRAG